MSMFEPGDSADQADALIAQNERDAIAAALAGRRSDIVDREDEARPDRVPGEPRLDFGDGDDSDDPVHAGGDDVAVLPAGAPADEAWADDGGIVENDNIVTGRLADHD